MTRTDYMNGTVDHHTYYLAIADVIGRSALTRLILSFVADRTRLCMSTDPHLNDIPLAKWDRMDGSVQHLVSLNAQAVMALSWNGQPLLPKTFCWSLAETVCVLKAVAREVIRSSEVTC